MGTVITALGVLAPALPSLLQFCRMLNISADDTPEQSEAKIRAFISSSEGNTSLGNQAVDQAAADFAARRAGSHD